jgi:hypothetical protein
MLIVGGKLITDEALRVPAVRVAKSVSPMGAIVVKGTVSEKYVTQSVQE